MTCLFDREQKSIYRYRLLILSNIVNLKVIIKAINENTLCQYTELKVAKKTIVSNAYK